MTIAKKLVVGFAPPLVILIIGAGVAFWSTSHLIETSRAVAHTHEELGELEMLMSIMKDAETGQRGYLLTGKESYLEPFTTAENTWERTFNHLRSITPNIDLRGSLDRLKMAIEQKLAELRQTIELRKQQPGAAGFDAALAVVMNDRGKRLMDEVRQIAQAIRVEQERLLQQRAAEAESNARLAQWLIGVATAVAACVVIVAAVLIIRSITTPVRAAINQSVLGQRGDPGQHHPAGGRCPGTGRGRRPDRDHRQRGDADRRPVGPARRGGRRGRPAHSPGEQGRPQGRRGLDHRPGSVRSRWKRRPRTS